MIPATNRTFVVTTRTFGELVKVDTNIKSCRAWAKKAFERGEVLGVQINRPPRCSDCSEKRSACSRCRRRK